MIMHIRIAQALESENANTKVKFDRASNGRRCGITLRDEPIGEFQFCAQPPKDRGSRLDGLVPSQLGPCLAKILHCAS